MSKSLTAQDRSALIKLASSLEKGSEERRAILSGLKKSAVNHETRAQFIRSADIEPRARFVVPRDMLILPGGREDTYDPTVALKGATVVVDNVRRNARGEITSLIVTVSKVAGGAPWADKGFKEGVHARQIKIPTSGMDAHHPVKFMYNLLTGEGGPLGRLSSNTRPQSPG